jgi:hypothetical protein
MRWSLWQVHGSWQESFYKNGYRFLIHASGSRAGTVAQKHKENSV